MKLFVWGDYDGKLNPPSYGGRCLYVVAETIEQARQLAKQAPIHRYGWGDPSGCGVNVDRIEPTRVTDAPCAEIYEWEE